MSKNYNSVDFNAGSSIEDAVRKLLSYKEKGVLVCGEFNGTALYSDTVTMDGAYKDITGKTKFEFDKAQQEWRDDYSKKEKEHKEIIPTLAQEWMTEGRKFLTEDKWELWDKIVPIRLNDLYRGMELGNCLDIVKILNNNGTLTEAKQEIENQNHSGMSWGLVCAMVKEFSGRGQEFCDFVR